MNYDVIELSEVDIATGTEKLKNQEVDEYEIFYIGFIDADSGEVVDIEHPEGGQDPLINWFTVDLIRNAFPDLRKAMPEYQNVEIV